MALWIHRLNNPGAALESTIIKPRSSRKGFSLDEAYKLIGCQTLEELTLFDGRVMLMDEDATVLRERPPVNELASEMAGRMILGNVLIVDRKEFK